MVDIEDGDKYESELSAIHRLDEEALEKLEKQAGLDGGGLWWIDPSQTPVEVDSRGEYDEGAIVDVEAQVRGWLRHSFDRNPVFRDHNYHLLNRLNELARLQGLVEEAQLQQQSLGSSFDWRDRQVYHSSLSLHANGLPNLGASYDLANPTIALHHFDVHRSLEGSLSQQQQQQQCAQIGYNYATSGQNGTPDMLRGSFSGYGSPEMDQTSRSTSQLYYPPNQAPLYEGALNDGHLSAKPSGMPQVHRNPKQLPKYGLHDPRKRPSYPGMANYLPLPDVTSSPDRSHDRRKTLLSRTYSKEQLDVLRDNENNPGKRKTSPHGSLLDNLIKPNLTSSLPLSDADSEVDVTKSLDVPHGLNPLSQSLSDAHMLQVAGIRPNMSYSSMRSSDVIEMARLQESHLRKHSGSRNKLHGSSGSLTSSLLDVRASADQALRSSISSGHSDECDTNKLSLTDLSKSHDGTVAFRNKSPRAPERQITVRAREVKDNEENEDNRRTLIMYDLENLTDKITQSNQKIPQLPEGPTGDHEKSGPPTPVLNYPPQTGVVPNSTSAESGPANSFFPQSPTKDVQAVVSPSSDGTSSVARLDSFEMLEARMSSDPISPNALKNDAPNIPSLSNVPPGSNTEPPLSAKMPLPKQPSRSGSPTPSHTQRPSNARPLTNQAPSNTSGTVRLRAHTRLPVQSKIPSAGLMPTSTRTGVRPPTAPQSMSSTGPQLRSTSRPSSAGPSGLRARPKDPTSQMQPNATSASRTAVSSTSARPKIDASSRQSRPTTSQLQVTRSDTSPVRSSRMNNKRLGQHPAVPNTRRN
ncbi:hypothetical protein FBUS_08937 [Fasciolopsis buskii]|uniref:Uncharacterized protein n=1 Tax=Fasciolopsis buskii TaxID=27845 RepID=A0A8E0S4A1_9TREM|nr:hypothetical protein FBUS_08937 [Fasciolopsis buski]